MPSAASRQLEPRSRQIGTAHHVAAGEHLQVAGLELALAAGGARRCGRDHRWRCRTRRTTASGRTEAEGDQHGVGRDDLLGPGTTSGLRRRGHQAPEPGGDHLDALDQPLPTISTGWRFQRNFTPSSLALATSRFEPGMLASSRRYAQVTLVAPWRIEVRLQSIAGVAAAEHHDALAGASMKRRRCLANRAGG